MTAVAVYPLGTPRPAALRGGDARARDTAQGRNVWGQHRFAAPEHCRISNGTLRATVGAAGSTPSLALEVRRGRVITGDTYHVTYPTTYGGGYTAAAWLALGTLVMDSPDVDGLLTGVQIVGAEGRGALGAAVTLRLVAPLLGDVYVTLERGEPMLHIAHGEERLAVDIDRRIRFLAAAGEAMLTETGDPMLTEDGDPMLMETTVLAGVATAAERVEEVDPDTLGVYRFLAALDPVTTDAASFALTAASTTCARFGAGAGGTHLFDRPSSLHGQLGDDSRLMAVS